MSESDRTSETKNGRPTKRTPEVVARVIEGLRKGTPLTIICDSDDMPCDDTVRVWAKDDEGLSRDIARAREAGFDRIALDALAIADSSERDTISFEKGGVMIEIPDKEWILRSKLRVDTRLKLLAKWDPKRYGDKTTTEISGPEGKPIETVSRSKEEAESFAAMLAAAQQKVGG